MGRGGGGGRRRKVLHLDQLGLQVMSEALGLPRFVLLLMSLFVLSLIRSPRSS